MNVYQDVDDYMVALKELSPSDPFYFYKKADFEKQIERYRARIQMDIVHTKWVGNMRGSGLEQVWTHAGF